jgi:hypothetical protein
MSIIHLISTLEQEVTSIAKLNTEHHWSFAVVGRNGSGRFFQINGLLVVEVGFWILQEDNNGWILVRN